MLAGRGEQKASWEGAFGQMEALPAMETDACGQYGEESGPGFPAEGRSMHGTAGPEGLMASRGPQSAWHYRSVLRIDTATHRKLLSTSELLIPYL